MKQAEVWLVNFRPKVGQEIDKVRPAIIINSDAVGKFRLKIVVPVTDGTKKNMSWHVPLENSRQNGLTKKSVVDCFQVKSLSEERFVKKLGTLSEEEMSNVKIALVKVLDLF